MADGVVKALDAAIQERENLNALIEKLNEIIHRLERERDEARDLVRAAVQGTDLAGRREELRKKYPWIREPTTRAEGQEEG